MITKLKPGQLVLVSKNCNATKAEIGWCRNMNQYLGTVQTIESKTSNFIELRTEPKWGWHPDDLILYEPVEIKNEPVLFDINELRSE